MTPKFLERQSKRREMLRNSAAFAGSALLAQLFPTSVLSAGVSGLRQQVSTPPTDSLAAMRAQMGSAPIIYMHFQKANVIHMGDTFFNGFYPVIDASTGGKINGMILAADKILSLGDNNTKIVPGHGPLGNKADLTKYRDMLVVTRDRVQKLKAAGKSAGEIAASKPFADLDATWGKGFFNGDVFAQVVYSAL
jgi:hypothetical protein